MLIWLADYLAQYLGVFAVVKYLTLRAIMGVLTALVFSLLMGPAVIAYLQKLKIGQSVRTDGPQSHLGKSGTPTMGGVLILLSICLSTLLWSKLDNRYVWAVMLTTICFAAIGWIDDWRKVVEKNSKGLPSRWKYFWQSVFGLGAALFLYNTATSPVELQLFVPFFKNVAIDLGWFYVPRYIKPTKVNGYIFEKRHE